MARDLLLSHQAARVLGITPDAVRAMARSGRLSAARVVGRVRLFDRREIEDLRRVRERTRRQKAAAAAGSR